LIATSFFLGHLGAFFMIQGKCFSGTLEPENESNSPFQPEGVDIEISQNRMDPRVSKLLTWVRIAMNLKPLRGSLSFTICNCDRDEGDIS
jgi:hypothetical protein